MPRVTAADRAAFNANASATKAEGTARRFAKELPDGEG